MAITEDPCCVESKLPVSSIPEPGTKIKVPLGPDSFTYYLVVTAPGFHDHKLEPEFLVSGWYIQVKILGYKNLLWLPWTKS